MKSQINRIANRAVIVALLKAHVAHHHRAGANSHAETNLGQLCAARRSLKIGQIALNSQPGLHGLQRVVRLGQRRVEDSHNQVAGVLVERSLMADQGQTNNA